MDKPVTKYIIQAAAVVCCVLFLVIGNRLTARDPVDTTFTEGFYYFTAVVTEITAREFIEFPHAWGADNTALQTRFNARITSGDRRGDIIPGEQEIADFFMMNYPEVRVGDRVTIVHNTFAELYHFDGFARFNYVLVLGILFLALVIVFARMKGFNAIIALAFTCLAVFLVFVPAILTGRNIYMTTLVICFFAIISTLVIVIGVNKKALSAMLGCVGGVLTAAGLMLAVSRGARLLGFIDMDTMSLLNLPIETPIDLRALVFAGVILGAVGAIIDVAMSISSSLWELREAGGVSDFKSIFRSGMNIGKDIMGTMLNTLILAYIGSSLTLILLIVAYTTSYTALFNEELIIVEFFRALVGSFGMLLTIPLTALICGALYGEDKEANHWKNAKTGYFKQ